MSIPSYGFDEVKAELAQLMNTILEADDSIASKARIEEMTKSLARKLADMKDRLSKLPGANLTESMQREEINRLKKVEETTVALLAKVDDVYSHHKTKI